MQEYTECTNPATGETIGKSPLHTPEQVREAVQKARKAQPAWARMPIEERVACVLRIQEYVARNADEIAATISKDTGKTRVDALATEVVPAVMAAGYYAKHAPKWLEPERLKTGNILFANKVSHIERVPFGVVAVISPWNYPFAIPFSEVIMALLAGNAVVLKVATQTQMAGLALERAIRAGGMPADVFQYVNVPGRVAGDAILGAGIDKLFFTGSVPVGKALMAKAAETLTPVSLELGGNDPMLVCPDADLDRAAAGAVWAGLQNAGQSCGGVERIYVHEQVYDEFLEKLSARVRALRVGPDTDFEVDMGSMTTPGQLRVVRRHVEDALEKGATIHAQSVCPPEDSGGLFHPAMVLTNVNHDMLVMKEETFGPLLGVMRVRDMDEAVELANDSNLGLTASVWTNDRAEASRLAQRLEAGVVTINDHLMSHGMAETPWGGFKESGIGRTHGRIGFEEMTQPRCVVHDYLPGVKKNMWWHPHGRKVYEGVKSILELMYTGEPVKGIQGLAKLFPRTFVK